MKRVLLILFIMFMCIIAAPVTAAASSDEEELTEKEDRILTENEAGIDSSVLSLAGNEIVVDVNSGALPGAGFVSVNEVLQTDSGSYDLIMYGLKEDNKDAVINVLEENYDPDGSDVLKLVDAAIADAEKYDSDPYDLWNTYDSSQCWAASAANMLWMSGWAEGLINPLTNAPFTSEDDLFVFFNENFTDAGAEVSAGIDWFFTGEFYNPGYSGARAILRQPKDPEDGLMKEFASMLVQERFDLIETPEEIARLADCDWTSETPAVFQASIGELFDGKITRSDHSVTVAGIVVDMLAENLQELFKSILIIDSDNDATPSEEAAAIPDPTNEQKNEDKAARPNSVSVYNLSYIQDIEGTFCWQMLGYGSYEPEIIYAINRLPLYSRELVEQYTENEGTKNIVDNVDLKFGTAFTTQEAERIIDLYRKDEKELTQTEFQQGEPVNLNYFIANIGSTVLNDTYTDGKPLTVDWKVVRDANKEVVAQGCDCCELPIYYGMEIGFMSHLNLAEGELREWKPGTYTLYLDLNTDRNVVEAYYLNNEQKSLTFKILGEEPEDPPDENPDKPEDPDDEEGANEPDTATEDVPSEPAGEIDSVSNKTTQAAPLQTGDRARPLLWLILALLAMTAGAWSRYFVNRSPR